MLFVADQIYINLFNDLTNKILGILKNHSILVKALIRSTKPIPYEITFYVKWSIIPGFWAVNSSLTFGLRIVNAWLP